MNSGPQYYLLTKDGPTATIRMATHPSKASLVKAVADYYRRVLSGDDKGTSQQVWMFEGSAVRFSGDPVRVLKFPDGSIMELVPSDPDAAEGNNLLPPSIRTRMLGTSTEN